MKCEFGRFTKRINFFTFNKFNLLFKAAYIPVLTFIYIHTYTHTSFARVYILKNAVYLLKLSDGKFSCAHANLTSSSRPRPQCVHRT